VHVAEDRRDNEDCAARYGIGLVERFDRHGLLASRSLFAHCVHLSPEEVEIAHRKGAWIAHNPRSNMNNAVGTAPTHAFKRAALGTDGIDGDLFAEARAAFLKMRDAGRPDAMEATLQLVAGGHRLGAALFGLPFGKLDAGGPADLVVLDYDPPTPLQAENIGGHLLFGLGRGHVRSVMVAGRWVVRDRALVNLDAGALAREARAAAAALWERMGRIG
jgi:cytosine/adenosine deaminase-related metal-dependent hydrolase